MFLLYLVWNLHEWCDRRAKDPTPLPPPVEGVPLPSPWERGRGVGRILNALRVGKPRFSISAPNLPLLGAPCRGAGERRRLEEFPVRHIERSRNMTSPIRLRFRDSKKSMFPRTILFKATPLPSCALRATPTPQGVGKGGSKQKIFRELSKLLRLSHPKVCGGVRGQTEIGAG